jgi:hypothetical protein
MDEISESDMNKKTELNNNCRNSIKGRGIKNLGMLKSMLDHLNQYTNSDFPIKTT